MDCYNSNNQPAGSRGQAMMHGMMNTGASRMPFQKDSCEGDNMDIKFQIQRMEKEAYYFVLRAFIAQSDLLSWEKVGLITALRKELNVTDSEHGQILGQISSDESVKRIREWRKGAHESLPTNMNVPGHVIPPNKTLPGRPPLAKPRKYLSHDKPFSATIPSSEPAHFRQDQYCFELAAISTVDPRKIANHNFPELLGNKHEGSSQSYLHGVPAIHTGKFKNGSDPIQIRSTDKIIHEVKQMAFGRGNPDPLQLQKAMSILGEHERDILQALDRIANLSAENDSCNQLQHSQDQLHGSRHRTL
ncbi:protein EMSY-LIKE 4-like [Euphorbia lathyris]|uniref:protein EMSY-LIKE 4-like n=1 Tax=Euphorbia lathyris TaxID=212925 RepID=UPI0033144A6A